MLRIDTYELENRIGYEMGLKLVEENSTKNYRVYIDKFNNCYLFSYDTLIMGVNRVGEVLGFTAYWSYSSTTTRHQSVFINDYCNMAYKEIKAQYVEGEECSYQMGWELQDVLISGVKRMFKQWEKEVFKND